ncbi:hypothetical protein LOTGIDRAFT_230457 [Lottia gigantea]|uniref:Uncharacterized protein n=1 Tax=Lottia gigantea TaxID=225164 RepID=V4BAN9_LOTGI|nr:hypothetical protein LOTGIDRAFT_230457 [Lottia gigantea]ESP03007.1 hypothetical protein LOTGIDRAFT_230457 [Lottia gigantea]
MKNLLRLMGNANNKMKHKHKKPVNHENIDVNRSKTLRVLEQLKSEDSNHLQSYPELIIHSNSNMDRTDHQTESIPSNNNVIINHRFSSAPQLQSSITSDNVKIRKVLKDGRIVKEVVSCDNIDKCENAVHVRANNSEYQQQSSDLSEQNETDFGFLAGWRNNGCNDIDINIPSESNKAPPSEYYAEGDQPLTVEDMDRLQAMGKNYTSAKYHAYVNSPKEYFSDAKIIVEKLEKPPYNFKLFLPERQLLCGSYELEAKCSGKVISLLGENYKDSEAFHFINYFAKSLDPISKEAKLIPVLMDEIDQIPRILKGMYLIRYYKDSDRGFFWDKLSNSIITCKSCPSRLNRIT